MRVKNIFLFVLFGAFSVWCISCGGAGDPPSSGGTNGGSGSGGNGGSQDQFEVALVRIADLEATSTAAFTNIGSDPLAAGRVEVEEMGKNEVEAKVQGAVANADYQVNFCSFATGPSGCASVATLATDANGQGQVEFAFPQPGAFTGVFTLARTVSGQTQNEFVTGFTVPVSVAQVENEADEGEEEAFEVALQPVSVLNGGLGAPFGDNGNDPLAAGRVEVERDRQVQAEVQGAVANATYKVNFCRFGIGPTPGCIFIANLVTDANGNAKVETIFPQMGTFDGIFVLTRSINGADLNEFATGFRIL